MKANKIFLLIFIFISSCSNEDKNEPFNNIENENPLNLIINKNDLSFNLRTQNNKILYEASIEKNNLLSKLTILNSKDEIEHIINYTLNTENEFWKLKQEKKVIEKAKELVSKKLSKETIQEIINQLWNFNSNYSKKKLTNSNLYLLSTLNYHKSILSTALRAIKEGAECDCNIHPAFLVGKSNFSCQEEQLIKTSELKKILQDYSKENIDINESTSRLITYLNKSNKASIRFDDYYSFFVSKKDYRLALSNILNKNDNNQRKSDCSWYCVIGCGSSHGCCGNYSGCCFYIHVLCYVHDKICKDCDVSLGGYNVCFSGCVPD